MASSADILKEFFVAINYKVDGTSEEKVKKSVDGVGSNLLALARRAAQAAAAVVAAITLMARSLENLYYASRRIGSSADNIRSFAYAVSQLGGSTGAAVESLESFARFLRSSPGSFQFIERLGVSMRNADGSLRDTAEVMQDLGKVLASMPRYRADQYAEIFGIDERTLNALIEGTGQFSREYAEMAAKMGVDADKAARGGRDYTRAMREWLNVLDLMRVKYNEAMSGQLGEQIRAFTKLIVANADLITLVLTNISKIILWLASLFGSAALRIIQGMRAIYEWFRDMPVATQRFTAAIVALGAAWKLLNIAFAASPLGRLMLLLTAFLLLLEDYQTQQEGGESAIDWNAWTPQLEMLQKLWHDIVVEVKEFNKLLGDPLGDGFEGWIKSIGDGIRGLFPLFRQLSAILTDLLVIDKIMMNPSVNNITGFMAALRNLGRTLGLNGTPREEIPGFPGSGEAPGAGNDGPGGAEAALERLRRGESLGGARGTTNSTAPTIGAGGKSLLDLIGGAEGTDRGRGYNETLGYGAYTGGPQNLTGMTLDQIDAMQTRMLRHPDNHLNSSAAGRYQIVQTTLRALRRKMGLNGSETYDAEMQDRLAMKLMEGRGLERYRRGEISERELIRNLSREWASVPDPDTGRGHYAGQRRPGVSLDAVRGAVQAARTGQLGGSTAGPLTPAPNMSDPVPERGEEPLANPSLTQTTTIVVQGVGDPAGTANRVAAAQDRVNADAVRNFRGAVR